MQVQWQVALDGEADSVTLVEVRDDVVVAHVETQEPEADYQRSHRPPYRLGIAAATGVVLWRRDALDCVDVVRVDDTFIAFEGTPSGVVTARTADDKVVWKKSLPGQRHQLRVLGDELVAVHGRKVTVLDLGGKVLRSSAIDGAYAQSVAETSEGDYIVTSAKGSKTMLRVRRDTLEEVWSAKVPNPFNAPHPVTVVGDIAIFYSWTRWVEAVDVARGEQRWRKKKDNGNPGICIALGDSDVLWGTAGLARARASDGKEVWSLPQATAVTCIDAEQAVVARVQITEQDSMVKYWWRGRLTLDVIDLTTGATTDSLDLGPAHVPASGVKSHERLCVDGGRVISPLQRGRLVAVQL